MREISLREMRAIGGGSKYKCVKPPKPECPPDPCRPEKGNNGYGNGGGDGVPGNSRKDDGCR